MWFTLISLGLIFCIHLLYKRLFKSTSNYWEQYGIRQVDASGAASNLEVLLRKKVISERDAYVYNILSRTGEKFCGTIENSRKLLLVKDVELIKKILIKDFDYFSDRRDFFGWAPDNSILKKTVLSLTGEEWKDVRHSLTPTLTTGKIRRMMGCFNTVGKEWVVALKAQAKNDSLKINVIKSVNQYTVDVIASAVFGLKAGTVQNPESEFATMAHRFADLNLFKLVAGVHFPKVLKTLGIQVVDTEALAWFESLLRQGLQQRLEGDVKHADFIQLLADAKKGEVKAVEEKELNDFEKDAQVHLKTGKKVLLKDDMLIAQGLLFFLGGFSTTTNFITFALYALAAHPAIQEKLREEVDSHVKEDGGFDYDELAQLEYMDMFICEVLRLFPSVHRLERLCVRDYKEPESGLTVPRGALVGVPINCIHNDRQYYQNPEKFDPEGHFSPEIKSKRSPYTYLPFGSGPRNCIGMRFALIEGKAAVAHIVHNFVIEPTEKTPLPMKGVPSSLQLLPPSDLELKLIAISHSS